MPSPVIHLCETQLIGWQMWLDLIVSWAFGTVLPHSPSPPCPAHLPRPAHALDCPRFPRVGRLVEGLKEGQDKGGSGCHALGTRADPYRRRQWPSPIRPRIQPTSTYCHPQPPTNGLSAPATLHHLPLQIPPFFFLPSHFKVCSPPFQSHCPPSARKQGETSLGETGEKNGAQALSHLCPPAAERGKERGRVREKKKRKKKREKKGLTGQGQRLRQGCAEATAGSTKKWLSFCFSAPLISELQPAYRLSSIIHEAAGGGSGEEGKEGGRKQKASDSSNQSPGLNDTEWQRVLAFFLPHLLLLFFTTLSPFKWDAVPRWKSRVSPPLMARGTRYRLPHS